jgi:hypothetical protein
MVPSYSHAPCSVPTRDLNPFLWTLVALALCGVAGIWVGKVSDHPQGHVMDPESARHSLNQELPVTRARAALEPGATLSSENELKLHLFRLQEADVSAVACGLPWCAGMLCSRGCSTCAAQNLVACCRIDKPPPPCSYLPPV